METSSLISVITTSLSILPFFDCRWSSLSCLASGMSISVFCGSSTWSWPGDLTVTLKSSRPQTHRSCTPSLLGACTCHVRLDWRTGCNFRKGPFPFVDGKMRSVRSYTFVKTPWFPGLVRSKQVSILGLALPRLGRIEGRSSADIKELMPCSINVVPDVSSSQRISAGNDFSIWVLRQAALLRHRSLVSGKGDTDLCPITIKLQVGPVLSLCFVRMSQQRDQA